MGRSFIPGVVTWIAWLCFFFTVIVDYMPTTVVWAKEIYFHKPLHEVLEHEMYLTYSDDSEFTVTSAGESLHLQKNDYVTHVDSYRLLAGDLSEYLNSNDEDEVVVPVVDTDFSREGGSKVTGFVLVKPIKPRKLFFRRGEVTWDPTEGGSLPTIKDGQLTMSDKGNQPFINLPNGGGACVSGRDCFNHNGTCTRGVCRCKSTHTGTYCQVRLTFFSAFP
jgi:hypothetical protein